MPSDFLQLAGKRIVVFGVANRKSVAFHVVQELVSAAAEVILVVRTPERRDMVAKLLPDLPIFVCDVEFQEQINHLAVELVDRYDQLDGIVHSIAFGDYSEGPKPFHETGKEQFLRAMDISCYSLMAIANALKHLLSPEASVVTISISTTRMASENYGFMGPVKAALDSSLAFLAKSFSSFSEVRFNAVSPGLLKTSASAGIPGYVDSYLYAEQATLRGRAVQTSEVAAAVAFLLSPKSSGINTQRLIVDAGMEVNYFDHRLIEGFLNNDPPVSE
jgi:enoyl-[acyl-carrier protein] reductase I